MTPPTETVEGWSERAQLLFYIAGLSRTLAWSKLCREEEVTDYLLASYRLTCADLYRLVGTGDVDAVKAFLDLWRDKGNYEYTEPKGNKYQQVDEEEAEALARQISFAKRTAPGFHNLKIDAKMLLKALPGEDSSLRDDILDSSPAGASEGGIAMVSVLLEAKADVNLQTHRGRNMLMKASATGNSKAVEFLLAKK